MFCWGLCGYKVFLSGLRNCPRQGPCPSKVFRGFCFGADRTPHESRGRKWGCSELNRDTVCRS